MSEALKIVLSLSLSGTLLFFILLALKPLYKNKLSKRWQYYIWLIVIARMLISFTLETTLVGSAFTYFENINVEITQTAPPTNDVQSDFEVGDNYTTPNTEPQAPKSTIDTTPSLSIQDIFSRVYENLWILWAAIAFALLIRKITMYQSFVRFVKAGRTEVADIEILNMLADVGETIGVKRPVELFINPLISSPMLLGFFRPYIILPSIELESTELAYIMRHELTHYKHLDMFYKWLVQLTVCLHWFNPFAYLLAKEINKCCELSCDEAIIRTMDNDEKKAYGDTLLNSLKSIGNYNDKLATVTLTEGAEQLKERLDAIMKFKKKSRTIITITLALTTMLCVGATAVGAYAASPSTNILISQPEKQNTTPPLTETEKNKSEPISYVVECVSEKIIIKQGGLDFKIEVDPASQGNYVLRDNRNVPMGERYYRYNKWDIVFSRNNELPQSATFSSTITLTIPESLKEQELHLVTSSGNIQIGNLDNVNLQLESESGGIYIENTNATYISAEAENGNIQLVDTTSTGDIVTHSDYGAITIELGNSNSLYSVKCNTEPKASITLNGQRYNGGEFTIGTGGKQTITLSGGNNSFVLSNIHTSANDFPSAVHKFDVDSSGKTKIPISTNSAAIIKPSDIDAFTMELIKTTNCWDTIENFLPYMTSTCVENVVATVRENLNVYLYPGYEETLTKAAKYFGKGTKTESDSSLTRGDIDEIAVYLIDGSANWSYVKPLFPHMTKGGIEQVVTIFLQRTGNYERAKEAEVYMDKPINNISDK